MKTGINKRLYRLLFFALFVRLLFLFPQYSGDLKNHLVWGNAFLTQSVGLFSRHFPGFNDVNYPPLAIILFGLANLLLVWLNQIFQFLNTTFSFFPSFLVPLFRHENMQFGFLKLPGIFSDLGIGLLLYKYFVERKFKHPYLLISFYLFNPAVIYLSSVWGQIEPVTNFFLLLSLSAALVGESRNTKISSIVFFTLAALTKQTALWFAPFYLFLWLKELKTKERVQGILCGLTVFFVSYLPFGLTPTSAIRNYFSTLSGSSNVVADAAWNFWYFLFPIGTPDSALLGIFSVRTVSIFLILVLLILLLHRLFKSYSTKNLLRSLFLWSLIVFFLQTRVHERHLAPALVFGLLAFIDTPIWWISYTCLSIFHFLNLYLTLRIPFI